MQRKVLKRYTVMAYIEELAARHFADLTITDLNVNPTKHFNAWLNVMKTTSVVSGSFAGVD